VPFLVGGFWQGSVTRTRSLAVVRVCDPFLRRHVAVSVQHSRAQPGDCEDDPYHDHRGQDVLAAVFGDDVHETGKPGTDRGAEKQCLALTISNTLRSTIGTMQWMFAARVSGLASGLALAVRPAGAAEAPVLKGGS
jgi:hypothetical protein